MASHSPKSGTLRDLPDFDRWLGPDGEKGLRAPWPSGRLGYLVWLATSDAEPWVPSPADEAGAIAAHREQRMTGGRKAAIRDVSINQ